MRRIFFGILALGLMLAVTGSASAAGATTTNLSKSVVEARGGHRGSHGHRHSYRYNYNYRYYTPSYGSGVWEDDSYGSYGYSTGLIWGQPGKVGAASRFQVAPNPYQTACDPTLAQTPHRSGILVALGDASSRSVSGGVSVGTWWAALTPGQGDILGNDW